MVNEAKDLAWNCELKRRRSDVVSHLRAHNNYRHIVTKFSTMSFKSAFKTIITFWRAGNKQKRFSKWARGSSLFWNELQILGEAWKAYFALDNEKARKSCEHGPENGKQKFNQTRRRSDNGRSARVDCHIYRKRNKYRQSRCYTFSAFAWTLHFFQFCHQRGKKCKLFSFSSKRFGNLKKDVKDKRLVNSVKYHYYP